MHVLSPPLVGGCIDINNGKRGTFGVSLNQCQCLKANISIAASITFGEHSTLDGTTSQISNIHTLIDNFLCIT